MHSPAKFFAVLALVVLVVVAALLPAGVDAKPPRKRASSTDPSYDHQTTTYDADHAPVTVTNDRISLMPIFSPEWSTPTLVDMLKAAKTSIDIGTPSWGSWDGCSYAKEGSSCIGCDPAFQRDNETFPLFPLLLNKLHAGVTVRILTNNYNQPACAGQTGPLEFLALNGATVRYFTTVTFIHAKYLMVDGVTVSISSINFSKTSFLKNREAGVIFTDNDRLAAFCQSVFDLDFAQATAIELQKYSADAMQIITNPDEIPVVMPDVPSTSDCAFKIPEPQFITKSMAAVSIATSPDHAYAWLAEGLKGAHSLDLSVYQITDDLCDLFESVIDASSPTPTVRLYVSYHVYDEADEKAATVCYNALVDKGFKVMESPRECLSYWHQKYWIVDGTTVFVSTGNWSPTDYPSGSNEFPPYGDAAWRDTNRDFTISVQDPDVVQFYQNVFDGDYANAVEYKKH